MQRHFLSLLLAAVYALVLSGTAFASPDDEAMQLYRSFLAGKASVTTADDFREGDGESSLAYGTYTLATLRAAVEKMEGERTAVQYAFMDFGEDGTTELVLRLKSGQTDWSWAGGSHWTGVIKAYDGKLRLTYCYLDGRKINSFLYTYGYRFDYTFFGVHGTTWTIYAFDENGVGHKLRTINDYNGEEACYIADYLGVDGNELYSKYTDLDGMSRLHVEQCTPEEGGKVYMAVLEWSSAPYKEKRERSLIADLVALGAELMDINDFTEHIVMGGMPTEGWQEVTWQEVK